MKTPIDGEGPLVLPKSLLDELGVRPGAVLDIEVKGGTLTARAQTRAEAVRSVYGIAGLNEPTEKIMAELRDRE